MSNTPFETAEFKPEIRVRRTAVAVLILSVLAVFQATVFAPTTTWSAMKGPDIAAPVGTPAGQYIRIPNGIARASSSGDDRPPANAFDRNLTTFWRNRTHQVGIQYLEMDFNGRRYPVGKISLTFGDHYPGDYRFRIKRNGAWVWGRSIAGNTMGARTHRWLVPMRDVQAVRIYCLRYSMDDYFSVREMVIAY